MQSENALRSPVLDLVDHGLLVLPAQVEGTYGGVTITAMIDRDGFFVWNDETFSSPSVAAGHAITKLTGRTTPSRKYLSVNGWLFWTVRQADGKARSLADLRGTLPKTRQGSGVA